MHKLPGGKQSTARLVLAEQERCLISKLYLAGKPQSEIAAAVTAEFRKPSDRPYTQQAVSRQLKTIRREWRTDRVSAFEEKVCMELARIDQIESEAWQAWERSIGVYKTETRKSTVVEATPSGTTVEEAVELPAEEVTIKKEKLAGEPRFLQIAMDCVKKRCEILGLNAETSSKLKLSNPDGSNILTALTVTYVKPKPDTDAPDGQCVNAAEGGIPR